MDPTPAREQILKAHDGNPAGEIPSGEGLTGRVVERFPGTVPADSHGQAVLYVDLPHWEDLARYLRDSETFDQCVLLTAVDHLRNPDRPLPAGVTPGRFEVVAAFLSHAANRRLRIITEVVDPAVPVPSLTGLFPGVELPEREVYDLFGLRFEGHPDLVRVLMPDDWEGHPLRKDYPAARVPVQFKATGAR